MILGFMSCGAWPPPCWPPPKILAKAPHNEGEMVKWDGAADRVAAWDAPPALMKLELLRGESKREGVVGLAVIKCSDVTAEPAWLLIAAVPKPDEP